MRYPQFSTSLIDMSVSQPARPCAQLARPWNTKYRSTKHICEAYTVVDTTDE
jgi:hypothetical protein